jgi:hypothetical protein
MSLTELFATLPFDIVNIILSYDNVIRYRAGKYINRLVPDKSLTKLLENNPRKYDFVWYPDYPSIITTAVLHITPTRYYSISVYNTDLGVAVCNHSGIDYMNPEPGDEDESTVMCEIYNRLLSEA